MIAITCLRAKLKRLLGNRLLDLDAQELGYRSWLSKLASVWSKKAKCGNNGFRGEIGVAQY